MIKNILLQQNYSYQCLSLISKDFKSTSVKETQTVSVSVEYYKFQNLIQLKYKVMIFQNSKKTINDYSYFLNDKIGNGCSSQVYKGFNQKTKELASIKVIKKNHNQLQQVQMAETEIKFLRKLKGSPNILELKDVQQTKNNIYIITQLCGKGTLSQLHHKQGKLSEKKAISILQQIINGYRSLYARKIIHRDLKPENMLVSQKGGIKIGDFGFAIQSEKCEQVFDENIGSPLYMPYESLAFNHYSYESDIWAIGVIFLEMLLGKIPWKSKTQKQLLAEILTFNIQNLTFVKFSTSSLQFLRRSLQKEVSQRMKPEQMFSFSFLQSIEINSIHKENSNTSSESNQTFPASKKQCNITAQYGQKVNIQLIKTMSQQSGKNSKDNIYRQNVKGNNKTLSSDFISDVRNKKTGGSFDQLMNQRSGIEIVFKKQKSQKIERKNIEEKLTLSDEKLILLQVQSQVNYFRFLFKLLKKMNEILKTKNLHILNFKQNLLYLTYLKIQQIKDLKSLSLSTFIIQSFKKTLQYQKLLDVLQQYICRYKREQQKWCLTPTFEGKDSFIWHLIFTVKVLYENIIKLEKQNSQFHKKKGLFIILKEINNLHTLYLLQQEQNWEIFQQFSEIDSILQKVLTENELIKFWADNCRNFAQLQLF